MTDIMERLLRECATEATRLRGLLTNSELTVAEVMADNERLRHIDYEEIERVAKLEAEVDRLRAENKQFKVVLREIGSNSEPLWRCQHIARAALEEKK